MMSAEKVAVVKHSDDMDDNSFELHMNRRHSESLGGLSDVSFAHTSPYVMHCWRLFHRTLHRLRQPDINHEHAPYQGDRVEQPGREQAG